MTALFFVFLASTQNAAPWRPETSKPSNSAQAVLLAGGGGALVVVVVGGFAVVVGFLEVGAGAALATQHCTLL